MNQYNTRNIQIDPAVYQHPADRKASEAVLSNASFEKALQFISKNSIEKQLRVLKRSSSAQLTPRTAPGICRMVDEACDMFGVDKKPTVFLQRAYPMRITMMGVEDPMITISTELIGQLDERALWGLLAPVIGGLRTGYCEIRLVQWLCDVTQLLPGVVSLPLQLLFRNWKKSVQLTHDRGNLIATGDLNTSMCGILAGELPMDSLKSMNFRDPDCDYMKQSREFLANTGSLTDVIRDLKAVTDEGLYYAVRYISLFQFAGAEYHDIIEEYAED